MEHVVKETILLVPQTHPIFAHVVHRPRNVNKVLPELACHVAVHTVVAQGFVARQFEGNTQHVEAIHGHPTGAVRLLDVTAAGKFGTAIKDADVVEPEKASLKYVLTLGVFAIDPPGEVQEQLVKNPLQKPEVPLPSVLLLFDFIYGECCPDV